jgi:hypothetical protein
MRLHYPARLTPAVPGLLQFVQASLCHVQHGGLLLTVMAFDCQQEAFGGPAEMVFCIHDYTRMQSQREGCNQVPLIWTVAGGSR